MADLLILTVIFGGLFSFGYYLGNQFGRTAHIREDMQRARDANIIARIQDR
ncbi:MAG: hypothetical protein PVG75_00135 [Thioalkalispiraceae bacterium]